MGIRWLLFFAGIFLISLGIALMLRTRLGLSPWDVFHQGLTYHTPLTMGQAMQLTGGVLILISWIWDTGPGWVPSSACWASAFDLLVVHIRTEGYGSGWGFLLGVVYMDCGHYIVCVWRGPGTV